MLLAGADLIHTMSEPGVWSTNDVSHSSTYSCAPSTPVFVLIICCSGLSPQYNSLKLINSLPTQLERILGRYGAVIVERTGTDTEQALANLAPWRDNIFLVPQTITNDVSSTKVRLFLKRGMSVRYLLPATVVEYIESHHLYTDDTVALAQNPESAMTEKGKGKLSEIPEQPPTAPL